jgi:integrase
MVYMETYLPQSVAPATVPHDIITIGGIRVLRPSEWEKLRHAMITDEQRQLVAEALAAGDIAKANRIQRYQIVCDALLFTGMRIVELKAMQRDWFRPARRVVVIPKSAVKKKRSLYTERTVMLSLPGCDAVERYLNAGLKWPANPNGFRTSLIRYALKAGISPAGITTKMFRKTWVSWLMACYPERELYISASMGHDAATMRRHYLSLGFERGEVERMREYINGWGVLV